MTKPVLSHEEAQRLDLLLWQLRAFAKAELDSDRADAKQAAHERTSTIHTADPGSRGGGLLMTERQLRIRALALFSKRHWPSIAHRITWQAAKARQRPSDPERASHDMFHARRSGQGVLVTFYAPFDLDRLPRFKRDAQEACRAANELIHNLTSASSVGTTSSVASRSDLA